MKVSIIGASGYTGSELLRILTQHPEAEIVHVTSRSFAGQSVNELFPHLTGLCDLTFDDCDLDVIMADSDVVFAGLPHGLSSNIGKAAKAKGVKFIDLGADFRLHDINEYTQWYETEHQAPELLAEAVYGLPELHREQIKQAQLIANPGCFPTSILLGLAPLMQHYGQAVELIIADSKSGTTGAGRAAKVGNLYSEIGENFKAYNVNAHRHAPEIEQELTGLSGQAQQLIFTPHLLPVARGILSTIYVKLSQLVDQSTLQAQYETYYATEPFVQVLAPGVLPEIKAVRGSNYNHIAVTYDERTQTVKIISVIDNLVKGASGQAVQNMNILFGLPETTGLEQIGLHP